MARPFVDDLQVIAGFVQAWSMDTLREDDLPRPSPSPAGTYHVVEVDQWGRVIGGLTGSVLGVANGGTGSDLSATGPGLVVQANAGDPLTVVTTIGFTVTFTSSLIAVNVQAAEYFDATGSVGLVIDAATASISPDGGRFAGDGSGLTGLTLAGGGTSSDLSAAGPGVLYQASAGAAVTSVPGVVSAVPHVADLAERFTADPAYCFTDAGGTTPAASGDAVRVWKDALTLAANYTQATAGKRPTLQLVGGKYSVRLDATDDGMSGGASFSAPYTLFICGVPGAQQASGRRTISAATVNDLLSLTNRQDVGRWYVAGSVGPTGSQTDLGRLHTVALTVAASGYAEAYLDGRLVTAAVVSANDWGAVAVGADGSTNSEVSDCDLRHLLGYNRVLTGDEILSLHLWALSN